MPIESRQSSPQVTDSALRQPTAFPEIPDDVVQRFPSVGTWMSDVRTFWTKNINAVDDFARAVLDVTEVAGVLVVDPAAASLYIRRGRGPGIWNDADTPFFVDRDGRFSLGTSVVWNPDAQELTVSGTIIADAGVIGGWIISATTLSKNNAVLDSAGQLALGTGNDIVILSATDATYRLWIGNAAAGAAAFSVTKAGVLFATGATISGSITATSGSIGGFDIGADYIRDTANSMGLASTVTGGDDVRMWAGATFANRAIALFRVTESGALVASSATITGSITATSGTIGGFTIGASSLTAGSGDTAVALNASSSSGLVIGNSAAGPSVKMLSNGLVFGIFGYNDTNTEVFQLYVLDIGTKSGQLSLRNSAGTEMIGLSGSDGLAVFGGNVTLAAASVITWGGDTNIYRLAADQLKTDDGFTASIFSGSGALLTSLSASQLTTGTVPDARFPSTLPALDGSALTSLSATNIASGTLNNARLPSAISVTTLTASGAGTFGSINIGATEIVTSGRQLNSAALNCDDTNGVKCNFLANTVAGADSVFATYMRIFMNGGTAYIPYRTTAP